MSSHLLQRAADAKTAVVDHAKSLPDVGIAEEADFETWGREYVAKLDFYRKRSDFARIDWKTDDEVKTIVEGALAAYAGFDKWEWLEWGTELMPELAKRVVQEEEAKRIEEERIRREQEEAAKKAEQAQKEAAKKAEQAEKVEYWVGLLDQGQITNEEFDKKIAAMDRGEPEVVAKKGRRKVEVVIVGKPKGNVESKKRERSESFEGEPLVHKCQLCEKKGRVCIVKPGAKSCTECKHDRKGCRFGRPMEKSPRILFSELDSESDASDITKPRRKILEDSEPVAGPSRLAPKVIHIRRTKSTPRIDGMKAEIEMAEGRLEVLTAQIASLKRKVKSELKKLDD